MSISAVFCWVIWVLVLYLIDPTATGILGFTFFYLSLFLAMTSSLSVLGLLFRIKFSKEEVIFKIVTISFRQAMMLSFLVIGSLFLKSKNLLTWWNIVFLILALIILEFFFISYKKKITR
jgi:hypothetical protein